MKINIKIKTSIILLINILVFFMFPTVSNSSSLDEIGYWPMDEMEGGILYDQIEENNGSILGALSIEALKNNGLSFDGIDDTVIIKNNEKFNKKEILAFSIWVKANEHKTAKIFEKGDWDGHGLGLDKFKGWFVHFTINNESVKFDWGKGQVELNRWYHLLGAYDGESVSLFVDGKLESSQKVKGDMKTTKRDISIGSDINQKYFNGVLDEARIFDKKIDEKSVLEIYNEGLPTVETKHKISKTIDYLTPFADTTNLITEGTTGTKLVDVYKNDKKVFSTEVLLNKDLDWSDIDADIDMENSKAFFHIPESHTEIATNKILYIPAKNYSGEVYICPGATSLEDVQTDCPNGYEINNLMAIDGFYQVQVTGTGGAEQGDISLSIHDSAESSSAYINTDISFFAEYKEISSNNPIDDTEGNCVINIPDLSVTGAPMTYLSSGPYWTYTQTNGFPTSGTRNWSVNCTSGIFEDLNANDDIIISNITQVPEFKTYMIFLTTILCIGVIYLESKRNKSLV